MSTASTDTAGDISPRQHLRVSTLGRFQIEWCDPATGQITPLPSERLRGQNAGSALGLLKALLSCPDRFATRAWLNEQFWPTSRQRSAEERLSDVVSSLRALLRPEGCTEMFVHFVHGANGRGAGFRLDAYPQLWCDADAFEWYIKHALLLNQRGQDSTACWERAYLLAERGMYLPEQIEDDWSRSRREYLNGLVRDCVHRWTYLLRQMGLVDEAIMRLRSYWLEHPTDEDALRPLLEMLGERERFGEAEEYYAKARLALAGDGHEPDDHTIEAIEAVRALKVRRPYAQRVGEQQDLLDGALLLPFSRSAPLFLASTLRTASPDPILDMNKGDTPSVDSSHCDVVAGSFGLAAPSLYPPSDLKHLIAADRRLSATSLRSLEQITWQWRALQRQGDVSILPGIFAHMTFLQQTLETTFDEKGRRELWRMLAQVQIVARFELKEKLHHAQRKALNEAAIVSARNSGDTVLTAAAIGHLAHLCLREDHDLSSAFHLLTYAHEHADGCPPLQGWLSLVLASHAAQEGKQQTCEALLATAREAESQTQTTLQDEDPYFTDFNTTSVNVFAGNCWLTLGESKHAYTFLTSTDIEALSANRQASAYYDLTRAYVAAGELEEAQRNAFRAIDLALATDNAYILPRFFPLVSSVQQRDPQNVHALAIQEYAHHALKKRSFDHDFPYRFAETETRDNSGGNVGSAYADPGIATTDPRNGCSPDRKKSQHVKR